jgi:hypothetical protein
MRRCLDGGETRGGIIPLSAGSNTTKIVFPYAISFSAPLKKSSIPSDMVIELNVQEDKDGSENME